MAQKAKGRISQSEHVLSSEFTVRPSGRRYNEPLGEHTATLSPSYLLHVNGSHFKWLLHSFKLSYHMNCCISFTAAFVFLYQPIYVDLFPLTCEFWGCAFGPCKLQINCPSRQHIQRKFGKWYEGKWVLVYLFPGVILCLEWVDTWNVNTIQYMAKSKGTTPQNFVYFRSGTAFHGLGPLEPIKGSLYSTAHNNIFENSTFPTLMQEFRG